MSASRRLGAPRRLRWDGDSGRVASKPILKINPSHPIVERLKQEADDARFADWSHILFDQATLAEGGHLGDPASFVKRLNALMLTLAGAGPSRIWTP